MAVSALQGRTVVAVVGANLALLGLAASGLALPVLGVALVVPVMLAIVERPQRGVLALAVLAPLDGVLVLVPHSSAVDLWKAALVVLTFGATFLSPPGTRAGRGRSLPPWLAVLVALIGLALVSAAGVGGLRALFGLKLAFFYLLVTWTIWRCPLDGRERDRLVTILMVVGFLVALVALAQQVIGPSRLVSMGYEYNTNITFAGAYLRSIGTFQQPFGLGFFEMLVLLIGIPVAFDDRRRTRNQLFLLLLPVYGLALLSSIVRGAWLGFAVGLTYLGAVRYRALLLLLPLGMVTLLLLPPEVSSSALSSSSSQQRAATWARSVPSITSHPLGLGIGSSGSAVDKAAQGGILKNANQTRPTGVGGDKSLGPPDNYYVQTVLDLGLIGLWLFVLVLLGTMTSARRATQQFVGQDAALARGISAMVIAAAAAALVATYFDLFPMDLFFWLFIGVAETLRPPGSLKPSTRKRAGAVQLV